MKKTLRRWLWLGTGVVMLGFVFYHLTRGAQWRAFRWTQLWSSLVHAHPGFLLGAVAAVLSSYLLRAYRWKCFLDPIKKASLWILFVGQVFGFSAIFLIGRPGEFVRPAYIAKKEDVPISSMLAIWLLERIYDTVFAVGLFALGLNFAPMHPRTARGESMVAKMHHAGQWIILGTALTVAGLVFFRLRAEKVVAKVSSVLDFLPVQWRRALERLMRSFADGLEVVRNWRDFLASIVSSAALWFVNASMVWLVLQSLGGELRQITWLASAVVLFIAAVGLAVQIPGLGGGFQAGAILVLTEIFSVRPEAATGAGILLWIVLSIPCLALGLVLLVEEGLTLKKLGEIAEEKRAAVEKA